MTPLACCLSFKQLWKLSANYSCKTFNLLEEISNKTKTTNFSSYKDTIFLLKSVQAASQSSESHHFFDCSVCFVF